MSSRGEALKQNPWHDLALHALYTRMLSVKQTEGWDGVYASHRASGEASDCAFYFGRRQGIGHRRTQTAKPDLVCTKGSAVAVVGEVEQNPPPRRCSGTSWQPTARLGRS